MGGEYSKKEVGKRLRDIRCKLNLTQERFAEMLDISTQLYKKMELGENNISLNTLNKMKDKLDFSADYLLFGERDTLVEVWNKASTLEGIDKQILLLKLFNEVALINNNLEFKENAEQYSVVFGKIQRIRDSLNDLNLYEDGKESSDT